MKVTPRSHHNALVSIENNVCKIRLKSPPSDGEANAGLIVFLAFLLKVPKTHLILRKGKTSRLKEILVKEISIEEVWLRLQLQL